jgi:PAS domain S-box-containing protein
MASGSVRQRVTNDSAGHHLLCTANATHFTSLNGEWERVLGWTRGELMSHPFMDFVHPDDRQRTLQVATKVGWPDYEIVDFANRYYGCDGRWHWLRWYARSDGATWIASAVDVTAGESHASSRSVARRARPPLAVRYAFAFLAVAAFSVVVLLRLTGTGFSGADSPPSWGGLRGPPEMSGPVTSLTEPADGARGGPLTALRH